MPLVEGLGLAISSYTYKLAVNSLMAETEDSPTDVSTKRGDTYEIKSTVRVVEYGPRKRSP